MTPPIGDEMGAGNLPASGEWQPAASQLLAVLDRHAVVSAAGRDGRIIYVNDTFCAISGYRREELLGQNHRILRSGVHPPAFYAELWASLARGRCWQGDICNRRKDGALYWVASTIVPFMDDDDKPAQYVSIRTDITALKHAQDTLRLQGKAMAANADGISIADARAPGWPLIYVNPAFERITGYRTDEVLGRSFLFLHGHDTEQPAFDEINTALAQRRNGRGVVRNYRKDGGRFWNELTIAPIFNDDGELTHFVGITNDVTGRHEVEEALRLSESRQREAQHIARLGHWTVDLVKGETDWCEMVYELAGLDPAGGLPTLQTYYSLLHPDDLEPMRRAEVRMRTEQGLHSLDIRVVRPDGQVRWMRLRGIAHRDAQGRPERIMGTVQDVTEEKLRESELEQASSAKSEFLSRMSHELRTPMHAILGFAQLMQIEGRLAPEHSDSVNEILTAGRHLLELINEVLDLSRIETGKQILCAEPVQLDELLRECLSLVEVDARGRELELVFAAPPESAVPWARADRLRLRQIVLNLLSNAVKYNRAGGSVTVSCSATAPGWVRVAVTDTGPGIDAARQVDLFTPFSRLGQEDSAIEGTGIGLVIAKRFTEMMGGRIGVDSQQGLGSTFWIEIPAAVPEAALPAEAMCAAEQALPPPAGAAIRTVLYIEDNPANLRFMQQLLKRRPDIQLLSSEEPVDGLQRVRRERPHLVLLDINLPGMDGYTVLKHLKDDPATRAIPVVAVSANAMLGDIEQGRAAGFADYLTKPLDLDALMATIDRHLAGSTA